MCCCLRLFLFGLLVAAGGVLGCDGGGSQSGDTVRVAFITNGPADFWSYAAAGCKKAEKDLGVICDYWIPHDASSAEQQRLLENAMHKRGMRGVAVSPLDPVNQIEILNLVAAKMPLICHDSDAPNSDRLFYLGTNNYTAGREVGKLVKEAIPDGGEIMIFVGKMDVLNAQERRQGVIDELADKPVSDTPEIARKSDGVVRVGKWIILDTRTDQADETRAKQNAEDAINRYPNLKCMVGLWGYNPPACLAAVKDAGKLGKIKIVAFDEYDATLRGILDGEILATVVQNPFEFGYQSVKLLKALAEGDRSVIPEGPILLPERVIRKDNAQEFWDHLKALKASVQ